MSKPEFISVMEHGAKKYIASRLREQESMFRQIGGADIPLGMTNPHTDISHSTPSPSRPMSLFEFALRCERGEKFGVGGEFVKDGENTNDQ